MKNNIKIPEIVYYHVHSDLSTGTTNVDSITKFGEYVEAAKQCGMNALGISEHGNIFEWVHKKEAIEKAGMKYIHCVEAYITEDNNDKCRIYEAKDLLYNINVKFKDFENDDKYLVKVKTNDYKQLQSKGVKSKYTTLLIDETTVKESYVKTRDNYHCILIAKNYDGVKELNKLVSNSFNRNDCHFYYMPRITINELLNTSDNIIVTSACLGGILHNGTDEIRELFISFLEQNKHRCFLEIQHHNVEEQIKYNKFLYELSKTINVPLITGTDTHALNDLHMEGRHILQYAKNVRFANEDAWDLTFKTPSELVKAYEMQNSLPMEVVYEAMHNTTVMADMVDEFKLDYSAKYPKLYADSEKVFKEKINAGVIWRGVHKYPNRKVYYDRIHYEYDTYKHNNAIDFMLLEEDYKSEMRRRGIKFGYSRGSVSGSVIAYLLGITEIDSLKFNLNFERFMNTERISLADIDTDWYKKDRKTVKDYLYDKKGLYCCDIVTFNTIALKGAIGDVVRGLYNINVEKLDLPNDLKEKIREWKKNNDVYDTRNINMEMPSELKKEFNKYYDQSALYKEVPYDYLKFSDELKALAEKDEEKARKKYPRIFKYVDLVNGVIVSVGNHPAGCVVSPFPVDEWFGTFTTATNEYPISQLNMKEIDFLNFVKLDILGLDNVGLIYKTCDLAGIPYATPDNIPPDDENVWRSIQEDTTMIFQWESQSATDYLKQLFSSSTIEKIKNVNNNFSYMDLLSIGNGAIRPAGESYRDKLAQGIYNLYGNEALDDFMKPTLGYMVYQEQIIEFLYRFCGFTMGEADVIRRHFSKKTGTDKDIPIIKDGGYLNDNHYIKGFIATMCEEYGLEKEKAEELIVSFLQVIIDASDYLFSKNHADPYSWIGYICGYLRYYYPLEFITTALNIFSDKEDKSLAIINYAKKNGIKISPIKFRHSISEYSFNKDTNEIFKGIASIKYMNTAVADEMYELRENNYDGFVDLLYDLYEKTSLNSRQIKILIELDFFDEFGDSNLLIEQYAIFDRFNGRTQIKKESITKMGIELETIRRCAGKETEKMFTQINSKSLIKAVSINIRYKKRTLKDKIFAQLQHLGYIDIIGDEYLNMACVLSLDTKYSPKLKLYSLKHGNIIDCKIDKKTFNRIKLLEGDIIKVLGKRSKPKSRRTVDGKFEAIPGTSELWITKYKKMDCFI